MNYWNNKGKYQKLYDELQGELVPATGFANSEAGEWLRCLSNVYYDVYNNGGGNLDGARMPDLHGLCYFIHKHKIEIPNVENLFKWLTALPVGELSNHYLEQLNTLLDHLVDYTVAFVHELKNYHPQFQMI